MNTAIVTEAYPLMDDVPAIKRIMDRFDFYKVNAYMTLMKWHWGSVITKRGTIEEWDAVPTVEHLRILAERLLNEVSKSTKETTTHVRESGGFIAIKQNNLIELYFSMETRMEAVN